MTGRLHAYGPTVLIPAAWAFTLAGVTGAITDRTVLVGLVVMDGLLVAFYLTTRSAMTGPVLGTWRRVLLGGLAMTLLGTADLLVDPGRDPVIALSPLAWMVLPGIAYLLTWRAVATRPIGHVYLLGGALSLGGAGAFVAGGGTAGTLAIAGLLAVGIGQTAGIVAAAAQNREAGHGQDC